MAERDRTIIIDNLEDEGAIVTQVQSLVCKCLPVSCD